MTIAPRRQGGRQKRGTLNILRVAKADGYGDVDGKLYLLHCSRFLAKRSMNLLQVRRSRKCRGQPACDISHVQRPHCWLWSAVPR